MDQEIKLDMLDEFLDIDEVITGGSETNDIAIVGLAVRAGEAENAEELFDALCCGKELKRRIAHDRARDADAFAEYLGKSNVKYYEQSYLERIDEFSPSFFHIPPKDAALIDPAQRMFLLTAYRALEDAGLSKKTLAQTQTGVFVGYTSNPDGYSDLLSQSDSEFADRAVAGKVNSIIASRLSYYLDLKGPAVMIDTACSSSLTAVHLACRSILDGECEMAIAGSVKYTLLPIEAREDGEITVTSANGQTRTFDAASDGTNPGEGVAAVILKPLARAIEDKDRIYALIKGSAINQDGASVGITAPNAAAQEAVIVKAWENAQIDPEKITYIEAHGTATKLGDPVEISGIERAFRRFTDKKQFCAVGSIKTNLGHLDCAAGIVGLIKCVLAIQHKKIPPQLHFTSPNREIDFINSPVYVSDTLAEWRPPYERICGVSSFGLSGTNCHVVLQEYPQERYEKVFSPMILPLSARKESELLALAEQFTADALAKPQSLQDLIFTAAMNNADYDYRLAIVINDLSDVETLAAKVKDAKNSKESSQTDTQSLVDDLRYCEDASKMQELCNLYMNGAPVDWRSYFAEKDVRIISMQGYPMPMERCWQAPKMRPKPVLKELQEPLIDLCVTASDVIHIYSTTMSEETHSEVREHIIGERNVLAGTVYVEMLRTAAVKMLASETLQIDNLVFLAPMIFEKGQSRQVQTILYRASDELCEATIQSRSEDDPAWTVHIQAKVSALHEAAPSKIDVQALMSRMGENVLDETTTTVDEMVTTGPRWRVQKGIWIGENEAVTTAMPDEEFAHELTQYSLYPSMLDAAVNCSSVLNGKIFCLPYYYGSMRIFGRMPKQIYSHTVKNTASSSADGEINVFDICIFDENGEIIATVNDYAMKKTSEGQKKQFFAQTEPLFRTVNWVEKPSKYRPSSLVGTDEAVLIVSRNEVYSKKLYQSIKTAAKNNIYELVLCDWEGRRSDRKHFAYPEDRRSIVEFFEDMENRNLSRVIFLLPETDDDTAEIEPLSQGFFHVIYALANNKKLGNVSVDLLIPMQKERIPQSMMMLVGMGKSILFEYSRLHLRSVLYTEETPQQLVLQELTYNHSDYLIRLDGEKRYLQQLDEIESMPQEIWKPKQNGTYLITGGARGVGLVIAQALAKAEPTVRLILLGRSHLLPQEQWSQQTELRYQKLNNLMQTAAEVEYHCCDVTDEKALNHVLTSVGAVDGIIHAAGLPGGGFIIKRQWEDFFDVLKPKIFASQQLIRYAQNNDTEFVVLFSSYASVLAVAGQADYIGANAYIDTCAQNEKVKVLNWGGWRQVGMALDNGVDMVNSPVQFMDNEEGAAAFLSAMTCAQNQILVGKFNYAQLSESLEDYSKVIHFNDSDLQLLKSNERKKNTNKSYDITVRGKDTPLTPTEQKVAQAWAKILGLREVDYQDKFLEVGGDSLSATYLQKEIDALYPNAMDITDVFVYSTIEQMATFIDSKIIVKEKKPIAKATDTDQMRKLLEQLASGEIDVSKAGQLI